MYLDIVRSNEISRVWPNWSLIWDSSEHWHRFNIPSGSRTCLESSLNPQYCRENGSLIGGWSTAGKEKRSSSRFSFRIFLWFKATLLWDDNRKIFIKIIFGCDLTRKNYRFQMSWFEWFISYFGKYGCKQSCNLCY